jgi:hypothetical protein
VEEFLYNTRNGERQLLYLVYHLLGDDLSSLQVQHAALWSGQMAALVGRRLIEGDRSMPNGGTTYLDRLLPRLVQLLSRDLNAPERCQVGDVLGQLGDPRFRPDAWYLPDEPLLGFVGIPAGPFLMGSKKGNHLAYDNEMPQRKITLPLYYIARYPVTIAQFKAFVDDSGDTLGDEDSLRGLLNHPVVNVTWHEAVKYCQWLTERLREWPGTSEPLATLLCQKGWQVTLPSETEWEKAGVGVMDGSIREAMSRTPLGPTTMTQDSTPPVPWGVFHLGHRPMVVLTWRRMSGSGRGVYGEGIGRSRITAILTANMTDGKTWRPLTISSV